MSLWILLPITFGVSLLLTWIIRRYALARSMMDIPNNRSSHSLPTPRGVKVGERAWLQAGSSCGYHVVVEAGAMHPAGTALS